MRDVLGPTISGVFAFLLAYLGFRAKNREVKVTESTGILKNYNDLIETYAREVKRRDDRIEELEQEILEMRAEHKAERLRWAKALRDRLHES